MVTIRSTLALVVVVAALAACGNAGDRPDLTDLLKAIGAPAEEHAAISSQLRPGTPVRQAGGNGTLEIVRYGVVAVRVEDAEDPGVHYAVVVELSKASRSSEMGVTATDVSDLGLDQPALVNVFPRFTSTESFFLRPSDGEIASYVGGEGPLSTNAFSVRRGPYVAVLIPEREANSVYVWLQVLSDDAYRLVGPHPLP